MHAPRPQNHIVIAPRSAGTLHAGGGCDAYDTPRAAALIIRTHEKAVTAKEVSSGALPASVTPSTTGARRHKSFGVGWLSSQSQQQRGSDSLRMVAARSSVRATMYRAILKASKRLSNPHGNIALVEPVNPRGWGHGNFLPKPTQPSLFYLHGVPPRYSDVAADELANVDSSRSDEGFGFPAVSQLVRRCFEHSAARQQTTESGGPDEREALEDGFMALRLLAAQQQLRDCSSVRVSGPGIRIECTAACVEEMAPPPGDPKHGHHAFAYRVSIENVGNTTCRVLGRHWMIRDSRGEGEVVPHGSPGIVGYTPLLKPGQRFVYGSGTLLDCEEGSMWGSLQCEELELPDDAAGDEADVEYEAMPHGSGVAFDAEIGPFLLRAS